MEDEILEVCEYHGYGICNKLNIMPKAGLGSRCENCQKRIVAMLVDSDSTVTTNNNSEFNNLKQKYKVYRFICVTDKDYDQRFGSK